MECLGLADSKELTDMFFNLLIEKQDLQIAPPPKSPFKPTIVPVTKDGSFKKLVCPIDVDAYDIDVVKAFLGDFPKPEHWQKISGHMPECSSVRITLLHAPLVKWNQHHLPTHYLLCVPRKFMEMISSWPSRKDVL